MFEEYFDVEELYCCLVVIDFKIFIFMVYWIVKLFEDVGMIECYDFWDGWLCYEMVFDEYYDYFIDLCSG